MKKLIIVATTYFILAEIGFDLLIKNTKLSSTKLLYSLHINVIVFGFFVSLILALLEANFKICSDKSYKLFFVIYNLSFITRVVMIVVEYMLDKAEFLFSNLGNMLANGVMILANLGMLFGIIMIFVIAKLNISEESLWHYNS